MTAATVDLGTLSQYDGKRVNIRLAGDDEAFEATIEVANEAAVILKRKGKSQVEFHDSNTVLEIGIKPESEPVLKARRQDPVSIDNIKRHLVDRHGYALDAINAMTADAAWKFHENDIDHAALGHFHAPKPVKEEADSE